MRRFDQADARFAVRVGGWLFRQRTWVPVPLAAALLLIPAPSWSPAAPMLILTGAALVALGEIVRLWAVRHIGVISRTRGERLGPLIQTGPFARVRNPLYLGNMGLWIGMACMARLAWLVPIFLVVLALEYHAIVSWEEQLLRDRRGTDYEAYAARVPRWIPSLRAYAPSPPPADPSIPWGDTLFSERGTLIAIGVGCLLLWLKSGA